MKSKMFLFMGMLAIVFMLATIVEVILGAYGTAVFAFFMYIVFGWLALYGQFD